MASVTAFFAAILALMFIALTAHVIIQRGRVRATLGHGEDAELMRRIRAQGNFAEYIPLALILLAFMEQSGAVRWLVILLGASLVVGRVFHAYSILIDEARDPMNIFFRKLGMALTLLPMGIAALICLLTGYHLP